MAETAELQKPPDLDAQKARLIQETASVLELDRSSPEFPQRILNLMSQLEKARETLGPFCATVGEGEDRALVFTNPRDIERVSTMVLAIEPETDYGPVRTTSRERLLVNRTGVYTLRSVQAQKLDYDPYQRLPVSTEAPQGENRPTQEPEETEGIPKSPKKREFDPSQLTDWANRRSAIAEHYGADSERVLASILASGRYPELTMKRPISGSGEHWTPEQDALYHRQLEAHLIGTYGLSPDLSAEVFPNGFSFFPPPTDTEREAQPLNGWYTGGFNIAAVTRPETVNAAFQNIPRPQPTPQLAAA